MKTRYTAEALIHNIINEKNSKVLRGRCIRLLISIYIDAAPHEEIEYNRVVRPFLDENSKKFMNKDIIISDEL
jgi:hypothetical protein